MARKFYYDTGDEKVGPVTGNDLVQLRARGEISNDTWVRRADSSTWRPLSSVNLREEEQEEANPTLWKLLTRSLSWQTLLLLLALAIIFIALAIGVITFAWPLLLVLFVIWLLNFISKS